MTSYDHLLVASLKSDRSRRLQSNRHKSVITPRCLNSNESIGIYHVSEYYVKWRALSCNEEASAENKPSNNNYAELTGTATVLQEEARN